MSDQATTPLTPGRERHKHRMKLTIPTELRAKVVVYQSRECKNTFTEALLDLVRDGLRVNGLMGGQQK